MKKLLILMLVLGLASTASAQLTLQIATGTTPTSGDYAEEGAEYDVVICENIWIGIYNDTAGSPGDTRQFQAYMAFPSSLTTPPAEWTGGNATYKPPAVAGAPGIAVYGVTPYYAIDWVYANMSDGNPANFTGVGVVGGAEYHCLGPFCELVVVTLYDSALNPLDTITIHQIPEPAFYCPACSRRESRSKVYLPWVP